MKNNNENFVRYRLATKTFGELVSIPVVDEIEENGKNRTIRYIPGESSIYKDEQSPDAKGIKSEIIFQHGMMAVPAYQKNLIEYLSKCGYNGSNLHRTNGREILFRVYDPDADRAKLYQDAMGITNVENIVREMKIDQLHAVATVLNLGIDRQEEAIRWDVLVLARKNPRRFVEYINDPITKRKYLIMQALRTGIIHHDRTINAIVWPQGGVILQVAMGADAPEALAQYFETEEGRSVEQAIKAKWNPHKQSVVETKKPENTEVAGNGQEKPPTPSASITPPNGEPLPAELQNKPSSQENWQDTAAWKIIQEAIQLGIVDQNKGYLRYAKFGIIGGKRFLTHFEANPDMWLALMYDVEQKKATV